MGGIWSEIPADMFLFLPLSHSRKTFPNSPIRSAYSRSLQMEYRKTSIATTLLQQCSVVVITISCVLLPQTTCATENPNRQILRADNSWSTPSSNCSNHFYQQDCVAAHPDCRFCCSAPIGRQCFNSSDSMAAANTSCPGMHTISAANHTKGANGTVVQTLCDDLCALSAAANLGSNCSSCVSFIWCYYCVTSGECISPRSHCPEGTVVQTCGGYVPVPSGDSSSNNDEQWFHVVIYTSVSAAGLLICLALVVAGLRCRQRMQHERSSGARPEARPLLTPSNAAQLQEQSGGTMDGASPLSSQQLEHHGEEPASGTHASPQHPDNEARNVTTADVQLVVTAAAAPTDHHSSEGSSTASEGLCQLCLDSEAVVAFLPCYHVHCCADCANRIRPTRASHRHVSCPFCRQKIRSMALLTSFIQKKVS